MAITDPYATVEQYRGTIRSTLKENDPRLTLALQSASRDIDKLCCQFFSMDDDPVMREFRNVNGTKVYLDAPLAAMPTSISVSTDGENYEVVTDYELLPVNASLGPEPGPYWDIELSEPAVHVRVTGEWGWPEIPSPITQCTIYRAQFILGDGLPAVSRSSGRSSTIEVSPEIQVMFDDMIERYISYRGIF